MQLLTTCYRINRSDEFPSTSAGATIWFWGCDLNSFKLFDFRGCLYGTIKRGGHCRICRFGSGRRGFASVILDATKHSRLIRMHRNAGVQLTQRCHPHLLMPKNRDERKQLVKPMHGQTDHGGGGISENSVVISVLYIQSAGRKRFQPEKE